MNKDLSLLMLVKKWKYLCMDYMLSVTYYAHYLSKYLLLLFIQIQFDV